MNINILMSKFNVEIKPVVRHDNIKAFVTWIFKTNQGELKIRGGTIREKPFGRNGRLKKSYDPPAVKLKSGYLKAFFLDNKELYKKLCEETINGYNRETGEVPDIAIWGNEIDEKDETPY